MPSKSFSQARLMAAAAHDPVFAKRVGVPMKTAKEFNKADAKSKFLKSAMRAKGPAFAEGGDVKASRDASMSRILDMIANPPEDKPAPAPTPTKPRSGRRNPDRGTVTPKVHEKPPQYAKGGSVRGSGCETKGLKKATIY